MRPIFARSRGFCGGKGVRRRGYGGRGGGCDEEGRWGASGLGTIEGAGEVNKGIKATQ